jgi:hypothetical protein
MAMRQVELAGTARPIAAYDIAAVRSGCCELGNEAKQSRMTQITQIR